jgi:transmembrane sensor
MPMSDIPPIQDEALTWVIRLRDEDFDDWSGFEAWLAADPERASAYHEIAGVDRGMDGLLAAAPFTARKRRSWRIPAAALAGVAAVLVALVSANLLVGRARPYDVVTKPGERLEIALADGTRIALNGDTALALDRADPRSVELRRGEAFFAVRHDAAHPFAVTVGESRIVDVGTSFDVLRESGSTALQVAEGSVRYEGTAGAVPLAAGERLRVGDRERMAERGTVQPDEVAGWRRGTFYYSGQPLAHVAADLARFTGVRVRVSRELSVRPFSGVVAVTDPNDLGQLGPLFRAVVRREGAGWLISSR